MKNTLKALTILATSAGLALSVAAPVSAQAPAQKSIKVKTADLNLETAEGQKSLDRRIRYAAERVCDLNDRPTGTFARSREAKTCFAKAKAKAERQVAAMEERTRVGG